jgi:fucose 4-O-acetylase-like acetyltransferase
MNHLLYEAAVQVVPLLLIALFLDRRIANEETTARARRWHRWSNKFSLLLNAVAFMVSLFILAGVMPASSASMAIVISAVAGSIGLLCGQIWQRLDQEPQG